MEDSIPAAQGTEGTQATDGADTQDSYLFADGVPGTGEVPEWFNGSKYKTVSEQAKGYKELEKKFGAFTGTPKDGVYSVEGYDIDTSPLMKDVSEWAKEAGLSNDGFNKLVNKYLDHNAKQEEEFKASEIKKMGDNAQDRIKNLNGWAKNNLSEDEIPSFERMAQTAGELGLLEKIINLSKNSKLVDMSKVESSSISSLEQEIKEEYLATNEKGQRLMEIDPKYREMVREKQLDLAKRKRGA